jgi:hypothetical protein
MIIIPSRQTTVTTFVGLDCAEKKRVSSEVHLEFLFALCKFDNPQLLQDRDLRILPTRACGVLALALESKSTENTETAGNRNVNAITTCSVCTVHFYRKNIISCK